MVSIYFASNLKLLRKRRKLTQEQLAAAMELKRSTLNGYENRVADPGLEKLVEFSRFFKIPVDALLCSDLETFTEKQLWDFENSHVPYVKGEKLRVISTTIDSNNRENIELVNQKAKAGYTLGYADPEFIGALPVFQLPFLSNDRKYRAFQIEGDSMLPIPHGSTVICEFVTDWLSLKYGDLCVVVTLNDGVVFKTIQNDLESDSRLRLYSLNLLYQPFDIAAEEITEIWKFVSYISHEIPVSSHNEIILAEIKKIREEIGELKKQSGD